VIASSVEILYDGTDITQHVMASTARFDMLMGAAPGSCEMTVVDRDRTLSFTTGKELFLKVDGQYMWGGYVTSVTRKFAFPVVDTSIDVSQRLWVIRGVDFNILFDKRVLRNPANYLAQLPNFTGDTFDGELIEEALTSSKYFDIPSGFDVTAEVDNVAYPFDPEIPGVNAGGDPSRIGAWPQQGTPMRKFFQELVSISGAVYYFAADKKLHYKALEDVEARWGFSDDPNNLGITSDPGYQAATIGFREIDANEDGSVIVNDALIWGGSEWSGTGGTVFARETNTDSIADHGRWQIAETHFGEDGYLLESGVTARARAIVRGEPGAAADGVEKGLLFPQWNITLTWFAHDVPRIGTAPDHLKAGDIVHIILETFAPYDQFLPLRSLSISFAALTPPVGSYDAADKISYPQFRGSFSLQPGDPYTLWRFLMARGAATNQAAIAVVSGSDPAPFGALFSGEPTPVTDGVETVFNLPDDRGYIAGTMDLYIDGLLLRRGIDYTESDPENGEITLVSAPADTSWLWMVCRTT
jgi:hypothetical protein